MSSKKEKQIVANNLQKLLEKKGKTQTDMAKDLGFPEMTVSNWMRAETYPRIDKIQQMADYFGVYRSDITEDKSQFLVKESAPVYKTSTTTYPYIPTSVSAGLPLNVEAIQREDIEKIAVPDAIMGKWSGSKDVYFMRVNGESMNKVIPDRSLIAVKATDLTNLNDGDIVVYSDGNDYSVKRYYRHNDKLVFRPDSTELSFTDYVTSADNNDLHIHGKVVIYIVEQG